MAAPKMRTLSDAHAELVSADPGCSLSKTALRRLVVSGTVRSVKVGKKYLIDMNNLEEYLSGTNHTPAPTVVSGIRRIEVQR